MTYEGKKYYTQGILFEKEGKYVFAKEQYLKAIASGTNNPSIYNSLAWLELEYLNGDPSVSYVLTQQAVTIKPDNADYLDTHGWALYHLKRYDEALSVLNEAYQLNPDVYSIHYHLGLASLAIGDIHSARTHFIQQIEAKNEWYSRLSRKMLGKIELLENTDLQ